MNFSVFQIVDKSKDDAFFELGKIKLVAEKTADQI